MRLAVEFTAFAAIGGAVGCVLYRMFDQEFLLHYPILLLYATAAASRFGARISTQRAVGNVLALTIPVMFSIVMRARTWGWRLEPFEDLLTLAILVALIARTALFRWEVKDGHCAACGYCLVGLPESRCPECGRATRGGERYERLRFRGW